MSSKYLNYRCKACGDFLTVGPCDVARLRQLKYKHDRADCCFGPQEPVRTHGAGNCVLFFDSDDAWAEKHASDQRLGVHLQTDCFVGPAVPR